MKSNKQYYNFANPELSHVGNQLFAESTAYEFLNSLPPLIFVGGDLPVEVSIPGLTVSEPAKASLDALAGSKTPHAERQQIAEAPYIHLKFSDTFRLSQVLGRLGINDADKTKRHLGANIGLADEGVLTLGIPIPSIR